MDTLAFIPGRTLIIIDGREYQLSESILHIHNYPEFLLTVCGNSDKKVNLHTHSITVECTKCNDRLWERTPDSLNSDVYTSSLLPNKTRTIVALAVPSGCSKQGKHHIIFTIVFIVDNKTSEEDEVSEDLGQQLKTSVETRDVHLIVGDSTVAAHRAVLATCSPVFKAMLYGSGWREEHVNEVPLKNVKTVAALQLLIDLCYHYERISSKLHHLLLELLDLIDFFDMAMLRSQLCKDINFYMNPSNMFMILHYARQVNDELLSEKCYHYIKANTVHMFQPEHMRRMSTEQLEHLTEAMQFPIIDLDNVEQEEEIAVDTDDDDDAEENALEPSHKRQRLDEEAAFLSLI